MQGIAIGLHFALKHCCSALINFFLLAEIGRGICEGNVGNTLITIFVFFKSRFENHLFDEIFV